MKSKIILGGVAVLVVIGAYFLFAGNDSQENESLTVGVIVGSTGEYAMVGENMVKGIQVAYDEWQAKNPDQQLKLIIEDDAFDAGKGLAAYKKLTDLDQVDALINMTSVTIDAIYSDVTKRGIPLVQLGEQGIEPADDNVFQILEGNILTEQALGAYAKEHGYKNIAVFISNNATFERFYGGFASGYGSEHKVYRVNPGDNSAKTEVLKALDSKPDAVVILMVPTDGAFVAREINLLNETVPLLFDASVFTGWSEYEKLLGDTNILNDDVAVVIKQSELADSVVQAYKTKHNEELGVGSTWGYDMFTFLLGTMSEDPKDHDEWISNMKNGSVVGASGKTIKLDATGVRTPEFFIGKITNGALPTE